MYYCPQRNQLFSVQCKTEGTTGLTIDAPPLTRQPILLNSFTPQGSVIQRDSVIVVINVSPTEQSDYLSDVLILLNLTLYNSTISLRCGDRNMTLMPIQGIAHAVFEYSLCIL